MSDPNSLAGHDAESRRRAFAHDLRGGLNRIRLAVEVLQSEQDPEEALYWVNAIIQASEKVDSQLADPPPGLAPEPAENADPTSRGAGSPR